MTGPTSPSPRILVVGAGLGGCVAAWCLRRDLKEDAIIEVWDGARGCGGRLATQRVAIQGGEQVRMNMGASRLHYVEYSSDVVQKTLIECLEKAGVVQVQPHTSNQGGTLLPKGASNEICRWMLSDANVQTKFQSRIRSIDLKGKQFAVSLFGKDKNRRTAELFDAVVFAGSPAEVRTTHGDMQQLTKPMWRQIRTIRHTRNCCLGLAFQNPDVVIKILQVFQKHRVLPADDKQGIIEELVLQPNNMAHHIQQPQDHSLESSRPQETPHTDNLAVLAAVTTEKFAQTQCQHLRATHRPTPEDREHQRLITELLLKRVCKVLQDKMQQSSNPDQIRRAIVAKQLNYWKYAQIQMPSKNNNNKSLCCFIANCKPPFVVVGDYFPGSHKAQPQRSNNSTTKACGFTAVVQSGEEAAKEVARVLGGRQD